MAKEIVNSDMLAHFIVPAFFVENGAIIYANQAAQQRQLGIGTSVDPLLVTGQEEYAQFNGGCLYLSINLQGKVYNAGVTKYGSAHLFVIEDTPEDIALQAYSLAAKELREPLAGIMIAADRLFRTIPEDADPLAKRQAAFINQNLYKMLRIVGNMSDASSYAQQNDVHLENINISSVLEELFADIAHSCEQSGIQFAYQCPDAVIYGPIDQPKLERGLYNLISNAIKFTEKGGSVQASVQRRNKRLFITITDSGNGIPRAFHETMFKRYQRNAAIEENRHGIGLGMVLAKSAAAIHGGAILMEHLADSGAKITMTVSLSERDTMLRSPILRIDYVGERSHSLVELADSLDTGMYAIENLK